MNISRSLLAASMGLAMLQAGCSADADVNAINGLALDALDHPGGSDPGNGLNPEAAMYAMPDLLEAMDDSLYGATNLAVARMLTYADGIDTLQYAVGCALPSSAPQLHPEYKIFGESTLNTTAGWETGGLSNSQKEDVLTCLVTRFNGFRGEVPIMLTGEIVNASMSGEGYYNTEEALWIAELTTTNEVVFRAWPLNDLTTFCGIETASGVATRTCGTALGTSCNVDVRFSLASDCEDTNNDGHYTCLGRPAIKSWLNTDDVVAAYRLCGSP